MINVLHLFEFLAASRGLDLPQATDIKKKKTDSAHEEQQFGRGSLNVEPSVADVDIWCSDDLGLKTEDYNNGASETIVKSFL